MREIVFDVNFSCSSQNEAFVPIPAPQGRVTILSPPKLYLPIQ